MLFVFIEGHGFGGFHLDAKTFEQMRIAGPFVALWFIVFAWLDDYRGAKITILLSLVIMLSCATVILLTHSVSLFWLFGMGVSLCVGPVQAASRSLMVRIAPKQYLTEMFGLYAFSGKATSFLGPWVLGTLTLSFDSQRIGMLTTLFFLLLGAVILMFVRVPA